MAGSLSKVETFTSGMPSEERSFVWKVENFKFLTQSRRELNEFSFPFSAGEEIGMLSNWNLSLTVRRTKKQEVEVLLERIKEDEESYRPYFAAVTICTGWYDMSDGDDNIECNYQMLECVLPTHDFNGPKSVVVECKFWNKSECPAGNFDTREAHLKAFYLYDFLTKGALILNIKFELFGSVLPSILDNRTLIKSALEECSTIHKNAMLAMLKNGEGADVIFKTKDDQEIKAHKYVLSAQSVVFQAMLLDLEMKEKKDGIVHLTDMGSDGLQIFLKYLYTGDVDEKWGDFYEDIIDAADKYQIQTLKDACDKMLMTLCTKDNCFALLQISNLHNLPIAKREIGSFISKNPAMLVKYSNIVLQGLGQ